MDCDLPLFKTKLNIFCIDPAIICPEYYLGEEYEAMATSFASTFPNITDSFCSNFHDSKSNKFNRNAKAKKMASISCSTSQLSDPPYDISEQEPEVSKHKFRKGVRNWMKFKTAKENETENIVPFWKGFSSVKPKLSFSALSLSSGSRKKTVVSNDDSKLVDEFSHNEHSGQLHTARVRTKTKRKNSSWYDLSRSQSCQLIHKNSKGKRGSSTTTIALSINDKSASFFDTITKDELSKEPDAYDDISNFPVGSLKMKTPCEQSVSMDDILDSIPHIDSSSSDDEDFRRRTLRISSSCDRPVSTSYPTKSDTLENSCASNDVNYASFKRRRPCSLMPDINLCCERLVIPESSERIQFNANEFSATSECSTNDKLKHNNEWKPFTRSSQMSDVRASVRLKAKAFKKRAKEFTNKMHKPSKSREEPLTNSLNTFRGDTHLLHENRFVLNENFKELERVKTNGVALPSPKNTNKRGKRRRKCKSQIVLTNHQEDFKTDLYPPLAYNVNECAENPNKGTSVRHFSPIVSIIAEEEPNWCKSCDKVEKGASQCVSVTDDLSDSEEPRSHSVMERPAGTGADPCLTSRDTSSKESPHQSRTGKILMLLLIFIIINRLVINTYLSMMRFIG